MSGPSANGTLVQLEDVRTYFYDHRGFVGRWLGRAGVPVRAVDGVSLEIGRGEVVGLVGESGSGKTTLGRTILGLAHATEGRVLFDRHDVARLSRSELRSLRPRMQMIFQDPYSSLSPRLRVSYLLTEPYRINKVPVGDRYSVAGPSVTVPPVSRSTSAISA